jgi:hypothetical protein
VPQPAVSRCARVRTQTSRHFSPKHCQGSGACSVDVSRAERLIEPEVGDLGRLITAKTRRATHRASQPPRISELQAHLQ